jgi:hypothetical protein
MAHDGSVYGRRPGRVNRRIPLKPLSDPGLAKSKRAGTSAGPV